MSFNIKSVYLISSKNLRLMLRIPVLGASKGFILNKILDLLTTIWLLLALGFN